MTPGIGNSTPAEPDNSSKILEESMTEGSAQEQQIECSLIRSISIGRDLDVIHLLDGGFASQLSCHIRQPIDGDVLWSARYLATDKEAIIAAHKDFLNAGAECIMTNSYQASIEGFMRHLGLSYQASYDLIKESVRLAQVARDRHCGYFPDARPALIVGSVGPYGAHLHDGSEYTGSYMRNTPIQVIRQWHIPRIQALIEGGVDLLGLETIPSRAEAEILVRLLKEQFPNVPAWLSFSVSQDGKTLSYGDDFQETVNYCYDLNPDQLIAIGVNCVAPRLVRPLLAGINNKRKKPLPLIVYPNSGETYNVDVGWIDRDKCESVETYVHDWLDLGVRWIGGCCRTYAVDIGRIHIEIEKWKNQRKSTERNPNQTAVDDVGNE